MYLLWHLIFFLLISCFVYALYRWWGMSDIKPTDCDTRLVVEEAEEGCVQSACSSIKVANMRVATPYLCALYVATAGHQGNLLGSDEQEIVLLIYVVVDMTTNTVSAVKNSRNSNNVTTNIIIHRERNKYETYIDRSGVCVIRFVLLFSYVFLERPCLLIFVAGARAWYTRV